MDKIPSRVAYFKGQISMLCGHFFPDCQLRRISDELGTRKRIYFCIDPGCDGHTEGLKKGEYAVPAQTDTFVGKAHELSGDERKEIREALLRGVSIEKIYTKYDLEIKPEE